MKSVIFYATDPTKGFAGPYWPVYPEGSDNAVYVRAEIVEQPPLQALDLAKSRENETVLNSMAID